MELLPPPAPDDAVLTGKPALLACPQGHRRRPLVGDRRIINVLVGLRGAPVNDFVLYTDATPDNSVAYLDIGISVNDARQRVKDVMDRNNVVVLFGPALGRKRFRKKLLAPWAHARDFLKIAAYGPETEDDWRARVDRLYKSEDPAMLNRIWGGYTEPSMDECFNLVLDSLDKLLLFYYLLGIKE